jgi:hypothetical protein
MRYHVPRPVYLITVDRSCQSSACLETNVPPRNTNVLGSSAVLHFGLGAGCTGSSLRLSKDSCVLYVSNALTAQVPKQATSHAASGGRSSSHLVTSFSTYKSCMFCAASSWQHKLEGLQGPDSGWHVRLWPRNLGLEGLQVMISVHNLWCPYVGRKHSRLAPGLHQTALTITQMTVLQPVSHKSLPVLQIVTSPSSQSHTWVTLA